MTAKYIYSYKDKMPKYTLWYKALLLKLTNFKVYSLQYSSEESAFLSNTMQKCVSVHYSSICLSDTVQLKKCPSVQYSKEVSVPYSTAQKCPSVHYSTLQVHLSTVVELRSVHLSTTSVSIYYTTALKLSCSCYLTV